MPKKPESEPGRDAVEARYANHFLIGHNAFEFLFDFGQAYSEEGAPRVHTRIVTSPIYAKALLTMLGDSVERHEQLYGPIRGGDE